MTERPPTALPRDVAEEIRRVAHFGRAGDVAQDVTEATAAFEEGRLDDALELLERAKHHAPRSPTIRALAGLVRYHREEWQQTTRELATYRRLSGRTDQDPVYADALRALGRPEKAIEVLSSLDPADVPEEVFAEGLVVRAGALRDLGLIDEAIAALRQGPLQPDAVETHHLRLWYALADALEAAGRRAEARPWWDAIYAEEPLFFDVSQRRLGVKG
jgi:tetratricopeptide (TPR) repeat protein